MSKKILLFLKFPPPITGVTQINTIVNNCKILRNRFAVSIIKIRYVSSMSELGNKNLKKAIKIISIMIHLIYKLIFFRPDLVYFQISPLKTAFLRDSIFVLIMKIFRRKIIFHLHGIGIKKASNKNIFLKKLYKFVLSNSVIISLSKRLNYDFDEVHNGRKYIIPNGIPDVKIELNRNSKAMVKLLFFSNLIISKGIMEFIETLKILSQRDKVYNAYIMGEEADISRFNLEKLIEHNHLSNILKYLGPLYGQKKNEILLNTDIIIHPSRKDALPLVLIEGCQFGIPIVSTKIGAIPDIVIDGKTGFLVDKPNPVEMADKVEQLIDNADLRISMGELARSHYLTNFTIEKFENNLLKTFENILTNN